MEYIPLIFSTIAIIISISTFYLTRLKIGNIKMTRPSIIFFGPDGVGEKHKKIFIRTLLYSSSEKGNYIENMYIKLLRENKTQIFNVWVYGDNDLVRGSGLYISKKGIANNHHFLMPKDGSDYNFIAGNYVLQVYVEIVNKRPRKIYEQRLTITENQGEELNKSNAGIYFDWTPNTQNYLSHIDKRGNENESFKDYLELMTKEKQNEIKTAANKA